MPKVGMMSTALFHSLGYDFRDKIGYCVYGQSGVNGGDASRMLLGDGLDGMWQTVVVDRERQRDHVETVCLHAFQRRPFEVYITKVPVWECHVPNQRVVVQRRCFL